MKRQFSKDAKAPRIAFDLVFLKKIHILIFETKSIIVLFLYA
ncbi:hypothetical protein LEP1GSC088_3664 [Leptospira interrogans str. L1207]|nr:hypothetical protein LEP1GSC088_3664 [Leptospira interrogans str. L1207]